jgi:hypothetical protein
MKKRILGISMALVLISVMAIPMAVLADGPSSGNIDVTATASGSYSITINGGTNVSVGALSKSGAAESTVFTVAVTTADSTGGRYAEISVAGTDGQLSGPIVITPNLQIKSPSLGQTNYTDISGTPVNLPTKLDCSATGSASATDVKIQQPTVTNANLPPGSYSESLTFTATFSAS